MEKIIKHTYGDCMLEGSVEYTSKMVGDIYFHTVKCTIEGKAFDKVVEKVYDEELPYVLKEQEKLVAKELKRMTDHYNGPAIDQAMSKKGYKDPE